MISIDDIYQVFKNYFGEDKVDLQAASNSDIKVYDGAYLMPECANIIVVHWPDVTVTNEADLSIDIWDLYSITLISNENKLISGPQFLRSTYDKAQWSSDYMHSHVHSIPKGDIKRFSSSCLGVGPINNTISKLRRSGEDLDVWNLYCWELDKYVTVESIEGVPYRRLQNVGISSSNASEIKLQPCISSLSSVPVRTSLYPLIKDFVVYIIEQEIFKFSYTEKQYTLALNSTEALIALSNAFIKFYNDSPIWKDKVSKSVLKETSVIQIVTFFEGNLYDKQLSSRPVETYADTDLFTFKGLPVKFKIKDFNKSYNQGDILILNPALASYILYKLITYVNYTFRHG